MDERIREHLKRLNQYTLHLSDLRRDSREEFLDSTRHCAAAERWLQIAVESCLNIGNRLIALAQFENPVQAPETYADIFVRLRELKVIDAAFSERLIEMARFRNRLVHLYGDLDPEAIYGILQNNLDDLKRFQDAVVDFLNRKETNIP